VFDFIFLNLTRNLSIEKRLICLLMIQLVTTWP